MFAGKKAAAISLKEFGIVMRMDCHPMNPCPALIGKEASSRSAIDDEHASNNSEIASEKTSWQLHRFWMLKSDRKSRIHDAEGSLG